jgi:hypothetical protein
MEMWIKHLTARTAGEVIAHEMTSVGDFVEIMLGSGSSMMHTLTHISYLICFFLSGWEEVFLCSVV